MSNEIYWGGINGRSLCKAVVSDIWMIITVMVITYLGLGIAGNMRYTPSFTSNAVVAVYPFNQMYTLEDSSSALDTVSAVNEVINSEMFSTGLKNRMTEPVDYSLYSQQIDMTFILMLSVSSSSPENAYKILRAALDYFEEISPHLVGNCHLEILTEPSFPLSATNSSRILENRPLLTLFMGVAMGGFLVLIYAMRKTFKTSLAFQNCYRNVRFFRGEAYASDNHGRRNKGRPGNVTNQETMRKTALEVLQKLRAEKGSSIFVTSATHNEGKTEVTVSLARELVGLGKSVLILETDSENTDISEHFCVSDIMPRYTFSMLLQNGAALESAAAIPDQNIKVIFANNNTQDDPVPYMAEDVGKILEQAEKLADIILIDGCIWNGSGDDRIWREAADTSLYVTSDNHGRRNKRRSGNVTNQETMRKTALEVLQMLQAKKGSSIFVTSATHNEGKTEVTVSLARELAGLGKSVLILETDPENTDISEHLSVSDVMPRYTFSMLLQNGAALESVAAIPDQNIKVIFANNNTQEESVTYMVEDFGKILEQAEKLIDIILIDGCIWNGSGDDRIWREAADTSLAVCRQDKADFYTIDRMMTDLQGNDPCFLGCVLYGF